MSSRCRDPWGWWRRLASTKSGFLQAWFHLLGNLFCELLRRPSKQTQLDPLQTEAAGWLQCDHEVARERAARPNIIMRLHSCQSWIHWYPFLLLREAAGGSGAGAVENGSNFQAFLLVLLQHWMCDCLSYLQSKFFRYAGTVVPPHRADSLTLSGGAVSSFTPKKVKSIALAVWDENESWWVFKLISKNHVDMRTVSLSNNWWLVSLISTTRCYTN